MPDILPPQAASLFQRDPTVGMLTIVVAGNGLPGAAVTDVEGKKVVLPNWQTADWAWWLATCLDVAKAMEAEHPPDSPPDAEFERLYKDAENEWFAIRSEPGVESEDGPLSGEIGWIAWAGRILAKGGRLLATHAKRIGKWAAPYVRKAGEAAWGAVSKAFKSAPKTITAGLILLVAPDYAAKAVNTAAQLAGKLVGHTVGGVASGLGLSGVGLLAIGAIVYFGFFHGKGE